MYGSETWTLTNKHENMLNTFERKMLRRICGPIQENNVWRTRNNRELSELFGCETIVGAIKSSRLRWAGHVTRMEDDRAAKKVLNTNCNMIGARTRGRPRKRWIDSVEEDVKRLNVSNWKKVAEDRLQWRSVVQTAKTRLG